VVPAPLTSLPLLAVNTVPVLMLEEQVKTPPEMAHLPFDEVRVKPEPV